MHGDRQTNNFHLPWTFRRLLLLSNKVFHLLASHAGHFRHLAARKRLTSPPQQKPQRRVRTRLMQSCKAPAASPKPCPRQGDYPLLAVLPRADLQRHLCAVPPSLNRQRQRRPPAPNRHSRAAAAAHSRQPSAKRLPQAGTAVSHSKICSDGVSTTQHTDKTPQAAHYCAEEAAQQQQMSERSGAQGCVRTVLDQKLRQAVAVKLLPAAQTRGQRNEIAAVSDSIENAHNCARADFPWRPTGLRSMSELLRAACCRGRNRQKLLYRREKDMKCLQLHEQYHIQLFAVEADQ